MTTTPDPLGRAPADSAEPQARRAPIRRLLLVLGSTLAALVFIAVCVVVGDAVVTTTATHAHAHAHAHETTRSAPELPPAGSAVGAVALITAVTLGVLAAGVALNIVFRVPAHDGQPSDGPSAGDRTNPQPED